MSCALEKAAVLRTVLFATCLLAFEEPLSAADPPVTIAEKKVVIPTYEMGPADRNPIFYHNESYQGAQKRVYPYPLRDFLTYSRKEKSYQSLELENQYVHLSVLPEIGGRLFSAVDKTNGYDFFYRQHVIKPALIGMLGAWISGGVEWCAFHHHRNTTFMPVDYTLVENSNGSKTIWFGEIERRHRMRWLIGLTLHPDKSYIETEVKFINRTAQPHSMLYWANVAVHVNDNYQVIFPPSVQAATYHSKIDFTHWPIGQGVYRGHDYTGVDISWWKNSPVSNSFFAWDLQDDFMGGYDHGKNTGVVHVGNHHLVCGAKLWEWGTGSFGQSWDKILTDDDGPYAELMVGAFSDNQPDYSWIKAHEVKTVKQYWYPIRGIGGFKNANLNGAVNLEITGGDKLTFGFCTTSRHKAAQAIVKLGDRKVFDEQIDIDPAKPFNRELDVPQDTKKTDVTVLLLANNGTRLISHHPVEHRPVEELPAKTEAPPKPADVETIEELYLTGLRIEQIHNPRVNPLDYYREALKREPSDTRCNLMLGIHANKRGNYGQAEEYLQKVIARTTEGYTRPRDNEAHYQLGLAFRGQHKDKAAYDAFYRASWDQAFHSAAYYQLAELSSVKQRYAQALTHVSRSLSTNISDTRALNLKVGLLRKLGRIQQARKIAQTILTIDPLDFHALNERYLLSTVAGDKNEPQSHLKNLNQLMRGDVQDYLELATDYMRAGMWQEAEEVLNRPVALNLRFASTYPMIHYYLGYCKLKQGQTEQGRASFKKASAAPIDYCFPFRLEGLDVLGTALELNPRDARAYYYLGNLLCDLQPDAAIECWEKSIAIDPSLGIAHRNLGWAYYHVQNELEPAIASYEQAIAHTRDDPRLFLELDTLYEFANVSPNKRSKILRSNHETVAKRQESFTRELMTLVLTGEYESAIGYMDDYQFHAQEGKEGIHDVYVDTHLLQGLKCLKQGAAEEALHHFQRAGEYPENLAVGRPKNDPRAPQVAFFVGKAHEALGQTGKATLAFEKATDQKGTSRWPQTRYYQAQSLVELNRPDEAHKIYNDLTRIGQEQLEQGQDAGFFEKFGQQKTRRSQEAEARFILGLSHLGLGDTSKAVKEFQQAAKMNQSDAWAAYFATAYANAN